MRTTLRWYAVTFAIAFVVIATAHLLRSRPLAYALSEALLWSAITAATYTATRLYQRRRGIACAVC